MAKYKIKEFFQQGQIPHLFRYRSKGNPIRYRPAHRGRSNMTRDGEHPSDTHHSRKMKQNGDCIAEGKLGDAVTVLLYEAPEYDK